MPQGWVDTGHTLTATSPACPEVPSSVSWEPTCLTQTASTVAFSITQLCQETHIAAGNTSPSHTLPAASLKFQIISTFSRIHRPFPRHFYLFLNFNKVEFSFMTAIYYRVHECIYYFNFWPTWIHPDSTTQVRKSKQSGNKILETDWSKKTREQQMLTSYLANFHSDHLKNHPHLKTHPLLQHISSLLQYTRLRPGPV